MPNQEISYIQWLIESRLGEQGNEVRLLIQGVPGTLKVEHMGMVFTVTIKEDADA